MSVLLVIPARYDSSRYPGKPLVPLTGCGGTKKTLIQRTWEAACQVDMADRIVVATDDERIQREATSIGAEVVMTSSDCRNGTERCAEALDILGDGFDVVVNLQGDAPLTPQWFIEAIVEALLGRPDAWMATPVLRCDGAALKAFKSDRAEGRVGATTAIFDATGRAMYFSKEVIPYTVGDFPDNAPTPVFHHVGVYAYRPEALADYADLPIGHFEELEGLEQLRFVENGRHVQCVEVTARQRRFWELNNPEDVHRIEEILTELGIE